MRPSLLPIFLAAFSFVAPAQEGAWKPDIEFAVAGQEHLTLDAWVPEGKGPFPAVIVVHGGGFVNGDKQTYVPPLFEPLKKGGFTWFTINYRLAGTAPFPAAVQDVEAAIAWVKKNAEQFKADKKRIALMGESAGGHLVSFVGAKHKKGNDVAAVVSFYGPHDLVSRARQQGSVSENLKKFLAFSDLNDAAWEKLKAASPATYVHKGMPPYLLIHGTEDKSVPYAQSLEMCAKMRAAGNRCEVYTVEGAPHGVGAWEKNAAFQSYKVKMVEWLKTVLR